MKQNAVYFSCICPLAFVCGSWWTMSHVFNELQVELSNYLYNSLFSVPSVRIYGPRPSKEENRAALCSFNVEDVHPTDIATFLDQEVYIYIFGHSFSKKQVMIGAGIKL